MGIFLFGVFFVIAGLFPIVFIAKTHSFTCQRIDPKQGMCNLEESGLLGSSTTSIPLNALQGANVQESDDTYKVVISTSQGSLPLTSYSSSGVSEKETDASQINAFVQDSSQRSLIIRKDTRWLGYLIGGIFILVGGGLVVGLAGITTLSFDKSGNIMTLKRQKLIGTEIITYPISQISGVKLESNISTDSDGDRSETYRITFKLKLGKVIPLTSYYSSGREGKQKTVDLITNFLNLPSKSV